MKLISLKEFKGASSTCNITEQEYLQIQADTLKAAAEEVETHWNDRSTIVNQQHQALNSATVLFRECRDLLILRNK